MKKIFYCLLLAVMLSSCFGEPKKSEAKEEGKTRIGDIVFVNGAQGVVFSVTPDGQHGKVVSVTETSESWDRAKNWCAQLGNGWRLPSKSELYAIRKNNTYISDAILFKCKGRRDEFRLDFHWSSEEDLPYVGIYGERGYACAWCVSTYSLDAGKDHTSAKENSEYVRAVCEF